jgi:hypothetical protein
MRAIVYKNLNRGDWSLATPAGKSGTLRGKVFDHTDSVTIENPVFVVQESGRQRVIAKKCREVHAWIVGDIVNSAPAGIGREISFNPYRSGFFHYRDSAEPVTAAACIVFSVDGRAIAYESAGS